MKMLNRALIRQFSTAQSAQKIGFVGLGQMGSGMVKNLASQYNVVAFDVMEDTRTNMRKEGINVADSFKDIYNDKEISNIIFMLPAAKHVQSMLEGEEGLIQNWSGNLIDCSTIGVAGAFKMLDMTKDSNVTFIDAPVSGGIVGANQGTLTFMVGSHNEEQYESVKQILEPMAKNIFNCKTPAGGQIVKVSNNMALAIQMMSVSESINLAVKLGMDPQVVSDIMGTASGSCWSLNVYNPHPGIIEGVPSSNNYNGGFACELMSKDLSLSQEAAAEANVNIPLGDQAASIYKDLANSEYAKRDFSVVYDLLKNKNL